MFGRKQYYGLVAGLRGLILDDAALRSADDSGPVFDAAAVYGEIRHELSRKDRRDAGLLWSLMNIYGLRRERIEWLYDRCAKHGCRFLREWATFDRDLRNAIATQTARSKGWNPAEATLGEMESDRQSYADSLSAALEMTNAVDKERAIDLVRWEKAGELSEMDTFGISSILAYIVRTGIIARWAALDPQTGREMYRRLVSGIKNRE